MIMEGGETILVAVNSWILIILQCKMNLDCIPSKEKIRKVKRYAIFWGPNYLSVKPPLPVEDHKRFTDPGCDQLKRGDFFTCTGTLTTPKKNSGSRLQHSGMTGC
jgi:hypothetical protein